VKEVDERLHKLEHKIHHLEEEYLKTGCTFAGVAFISFQSEDMKEHVLSHNSHTVTERILSWLYKGRTPNLVEEDLQWRG
jgi:hypothetical protein